MFQKQSHYWGEIVGFTQPVILLTSAVHSLLSLAIFMTSLHVELIFWSSLGTLLFHKFYGLSCFFLFQMYWSLVLVLQCLSMPTSIWHLIALINLFIAFDFLRHYQNFAPGNLSNVFSIPQMVSKLFLMLTNFLL